MHGYNPDSLTMSICNIQELLDGHFRAVENQGKWREIDLFGRDPDLAGFIARKTCKPIGYY